MKTEAQQLFIRDYSYTLDPAQIAHFPLAERDQSRLLVYRNGSIFDDRFIHLPQHLPPHSTLILNNTRVIEARILFFKPTGGAIEIFCLEPWQQSIEQALSAVGRVRWQCLIGGASKWKAGQLLEKTVQVGADSIRLEARYITKEPDSFIIEFQWDSSRSFAEILHAAGLIPLPPYIRRNATAEDKERYQTIFSEREGSVAAPTAALHFTENVFSALAQKNINASYITLHVGAGTFKPVKSETVAEHEMHKEPFSVSVAVLKQLLSENIVAVGTTSLRTIESIYWLGVKLKNGLIKDDWTLGQWEAYDLEKNTAPVSLEESISAITGWLDARGATELNCSTSLIIVPGYRFRIPKGLITNFHQSQSTLLLLVAAFIGQDWEKVYRHAVDNGYRFLSYGDSSLLWRS